MNLYYTSNAPGIFNHSFNTGAAIQSGGCRALVYGGVMFCVFRGGAAKGAIQFISRSIDGNQWSAPADIPLDKEEGQLPELFIFQGTLYVFQSGGTSIYQNSSLAVYDRGSKRFERVPFGHHFDGTPSIVEFKGHLHVFFRVPEKNWIMQRRSTDLEQWRAAYKVKGLGVNVTASDNPVAIAYQGLIHLFYKDDAGQTMLVKYDGEDAWTQPRVFIEQAYGYMPSVTIHNGLLKLVYSHHIGSGDDFAVYQYAYDGNSLSPRTRSSGLRSTEQVGLGVLGVNLVLVHRGV